MTTPEQPSQTPEAAYRQNYTEICELMLNINGKLYADAHNAQPKTWTQVGDQGHIVELLRELDEFLGI